jgi:hypothetical protein
MSNTTTSISQPPILATVYLLLRAHRITSSLIRLITRREIIPSRRDPSGENTLQFIVAVQRHAHAVFALDEDAAFHGVHETVGAGWHVVAGEESGCCVTMRVSACSKDDLTAEPTIARPER